MGVFIWVQLNDALGIINDIARAGFLRHHIGAGRQLTQVNLSVLVGPELLGAVVTGYGLDFK